MSEVRLTPAQQRAVDRRDGGLLVTAGAGAGKTSVLVERFVRAVLDDGVAVEAMLAITFTEKAAAQLRSRVRARFADLGELELAREAESAHISTIHGFCSQILRTHALAAGLDPEYRVLDELEAERVARDAFDRTLAGFLHEGASPERLQLVAAYTPDRLGSMVRTAYRHLRSQGQEHPDLPEVGPPQLGDEPAALERAARAALAELGALEGTAVGKARGRLEGCLDMLGRLPAGELPEPADIENLETGRGANALKTPAFDEYAEAYGALKALALARREYLDHALLRELLASYGDIYARLKAERSGLDFDDLELIARRLLVGDEGVRARWAGRFGHVLVDEFQDTNPLQNELIELIAGDRAFRVGDEFQSIYRFRHADVGVFRSHAAQARAAGRWESMTDNFRSRGEILDAVNHLFGSVWGERFAHLHKPEGHEDGPAPVDPCVELLVADRQQNGKRWKEHFADEGGDAGESESPFGESLRAVTHSRAAEARLLALRIDELTGPGAPFDHGDVVILLRATTHLAAYETALRDRGIPTYVMGGRGYWAQQQVSDLRAYLTALANPLDELALISALASPLGGASLDGLVLLRAAGKDPWKTLGRLADGDPAAGELAAALTAADSERMTAFTRLLREERAAAPRVSLETVIDSAVTRSGYDLHLLSLPEGRRRMANVRKLMRLAREFEAAEGRDLRAFIDFVAEREELGDREGEAPLETENVEAVRLMTVHRAKGLEFPVVCVADLGKPGREEDSPLQISADGSVGISLAQLGGGSIRSTGLDEIKAEQKLADEEEEKRVFYVAATRAERHLILSGGTDLEKLPPESPLCEPMRWIHPRLAPGLAELAPRGIAEIESEAGRAVRVAVSVLRADTVDALLPPADRAPARPEEEPAGLDALTAPALAAVPLPAALPVSRISYSGLSSYDRCGYRFYAEKALRLPSFEELRFSAPARDEPLEWLPGTVRGSIVHEFLEHLDLAAPRLPGREEVAARIESFGEPVRDEDVAGISALLEGFASSSLRARLAAAERVRAELPFAFTLAPAGDEGRSLLVNGIVDVHAREADRVLVVDYKSDRLGERTPAEAAEGYATQRTVYALAALRAGAPRVEVVYCFLERPGEVVSTVFEAAQAAELEARLTELARGIVAGRFEPSPRPNRFLCGDCPARRDLCSWPQERTLADPEPIEADAA